MGRPILSIAALYQSTANKSHTPSSSVRRIRSTTRSACCAFASSSNDPPRPSEKRCCCPGRRGRRQDRGWLRVHCGRGRVAWLPRQGSIKPVTPQAPRFLRVPPFWALGAVWRRLHPIAKEDVHAAAGDAGRGRWRPTTRRLWRRRPNSASGWPRPRARAGAGPVPVTAPVCPSGIPIAPRRAAGSAPMSRPRPPRWVGGGLWLLLLVQSP